MMFLVFTTFENETDARRVVRALVEEKLVACGTILPGATSIYPWEGKVEEAREILVLLKTSAAKIEVLEKRVHEIHPYEVPEFVAWSPERVAGGYGNWVREICG